MSLLWRIIIESHVCTRGEYVGRAIVRNVGGLVLGISCNLAWGRKYEEDASLTTDQVS